MKWYGLLLLLLTLLQMSPNLPPFAHPHTSGHHHAGVCVHGLCISVLWLISSPFIQFLLSLPSDLCQFVPCIHASGSVLFMSLLDSTYKLDHMVFVFLHLEIPYNLTYYFA